MGVNLLSLLTDYYIPKIKIALCKQCNTSHQRYASTYVSVHRISTGVCSLLMIRKNQHHLNLHSAHCDDVLDALADVLDTLADVLDALADVLDALAIRKYSSKNNPKKSNISTNLSL